MQVERVSACSNTGILLVANGCVTRGNLPYNLGQQRETAANTGYALRGKGFIRYKMSPRLIS